MYIFAGLHVSIKHLEICNHVAWIVLQNIAIDRTFPFLNVRKPFWLLVMLCSLVKLSSDILSVTIVVQ